MELHPKFSHWLSLAKITPTDEAIRKWWTALDAFVPSREDLVTLVGLARQLDEKSVSDTRFFPTIQGVDAAFLPTNRMGLAVLAATKLHVLIERDETRVDDLAKLLTAVVFPSFEKHPAFLADLVALADSKFDGWSRSRADWSLLESSSQLPCELDDLRRVVAVSAEETNMLWWLFGGFSRDLNVPLEKLHPDAVGLVAAKELSDLTTLLPGPAGVRAFLDRAIRLGRPKALATVLVTQSISELPDTWKTTFGTQWSPYPFRPHCRLANAITGAADASAAKWPGEFAALTGWPKDRKLPPATLANLFYRECLLPSAWKQAAS